MNAGGTADQPQELSPQRVTARCPQCDTVTEVTSADTMVYCVRCRKWCRPQEPPPAPAAERPANAVRRRVNRCH